MWHFLGLCWRDLWRNRRRTLLVGFVMVFAVSIMILFIGLGTGGHDLMIRSATDSFLGHAQIQRTGYLEEPDLEHQIPANDLARLEALLPAEKRVVGWAPRIVTGGLISKKRPDPANENDLEAYRQMISEGALLVGIKPDQERTVSILADALVAGEGARFLLDEDPTAATPHRGEIVLGSALARVLDVGVGDRVAVTCGTSRGRPFASLYTVVGLIKTGSTEINRTFALTNYDKLAAGLELAGSASFVVLAVDDPDDASEIAAGLNKVLAEEAPETVALGWAELSPEMDIFVKIDQGSMLVMLGLLVAIIGVILANIVTMSVMERTREYGVRLAVGESHRRIVLGLIVEIAMLALTFSLIGAAIGEAGNFYFATHPIDFGMGEFETTGVIIETKYPTVPTLYGFFFSVGTVVFFAVAGAIYPAWRVRKLQPVDALRFV